MADIEEAKKLYHQIDEGMAHRDPETIVSVYSPDAKILPNGYPVAKGLDAIRKLFKPETLESMKFTSTGVEFIQLSDNVIVSDGTAVVEFANGDRRVMKDCFVYRKENGKWRVFRDIANYDSP